MSSCGCWDNHDLADVTEASCSCACHSIEASLAAGGSSFRVIVSAGIPQLNVSNDWADYITDLQDFTHHANKHWWQDLETGERLNAKKLVPEKLMLIVSELSEAMEGHRKGLMDDKLPHRRMLEVELADALIRLLDLAGALDLDLGGAYVEKMVYNSTRSDHRLKNRLLPGGKKY